MKRAVLLAAGRGRRMGVLTAELPKCLTELAGRRLIEWQCAALQAAGVSEISAIGGYRSESLAPYVTVSRRNDRWESTNMVRTLTAVSDILRHETCIVSYSDIVYHPSHVTDLAAAQAPLALSFDLLWRDLWSLRFPDPLEDAETFRARDGKLLEIGGRPDSPDDVQGQYMGLLSISPEGWSWIEEMLASLTPEAVDRLDMTGLLRRLLEAGKPIAAVPVEGRWCETDNENDVALYNEMIRAADEERRNWTHDWRW